MAVHWNFTSSQKDYFLAIVQHARAGTRELREHWQLKRDELRVNQEDLSQRFEKTDQLSEAHASTYYSAWQYIAFHYALAIPNLQNVAALCERFNTSERFANETLNVLAEMNLVKNDGGRWVMGGHSIHLARHSPYTGTNHANWRSRAVQNSYVQDNRSVHYTSVGSIGLKDAALLKELMLEFIDRTRKKMAEAKEEELYCITCDWFRV